MEIIAIAVSAVVGLLVTYLQWSFKAAVIDRIDKLSESVEEIKKDFMSFKEKVIGEYARTEIVNQDRSDNKASHKDIWNEINAMKQNITVIETVQNNCSGCNKK